MPKVHCIKRRWLENHKLHACLRNAERILKIGSAERSNNVHLCRHTLAANNEETVSINPIQKSLDLTSRDMYHVSPLQDETDGKSTTVTSSEGSIGSAFNASANSSLTRKVSIESACHPNIAISPTYEERHEETHLPAESFNVMKSHSVQQRAMQLQRQSLTVIVPEGTLGISLVSDKDEVVVKEIRKPSVLGNRACPGDKIISIDGEDVSQMDETEISTMLALWHNRKKRKLEIKPSLASCMPFANLSNHCSQINCDFNTQLIYDGVKDYITANKMSFNEVRVLLQQNISFLSNKVGIKLDEIQEEEMNMIWSEARQCIGHWFMSAEI